MRSVFYVAVAVAVLARSSVVAAFTNADESKLLSKTTHDFAADVVISSDSRKRFLRVTDPEDGYLKADDEERAPKKQVYKKFTEIYAKLDEQDMSNVANILRDSESIHAIQVLRAAEKRGKITSQELEAAEALIKMHKS